MEIIVFILMFIGTLMKWFFISIGFIVTGIALTSIVDEISKKKNKNQGQKL